VEITKECDWELMLKQEEEEVEKKFCHVCASCDHGSKINCCKSSQLALIGEEKLSDERYARISK